MLLRDEGRTNTLPYIDPVGTLLHQVPRVFFASTKTCVSDHVACQGPSAVSRETEAHLW